jgi:hypothetical protein
MDLLTREAVMLHFNKLIDINGSDAVLEIALEWLSTYDLECLLKFLQRRFATHDLPTLDE